jgi:hypothetical protein
MLFPSSSAFFLLGQNIYFWAPRLNIVINRGLFVTFQIILAVNMKIIDIPEYEVQFGTDVVC